VRRHSTARKPLKPAAAAKAVAAAGAAVWTPSDVSFAVMVKVAWWCSEPKCMLLAA
jgi:hypothetical protein